MRSLIWKYIDRLRFEIIHTICFDAAHRWRFTNDDDDDEIFDGSGFKDSSINEIDSI